MATATCYCTNYTCGDPYNHWTDQSWALMRSGAGTGVTVNPAGADLFVEALSGAGTDKWTYLHRSIFVFDTSGVPAGATNISAVISFYVTAKKNDSGMSDAHASLSVVNATPANTNNLVAADYNQIGTTQYASDFSYASITASQYNNITLNAAGIAAIGLGAGGKLKCALTYSCDRTNNTPAWIKTKTDSITGYYDAAGAGKQPYLTVTYTSGTPATVACPKTSLTVSCKTPAVTTAVTRAITSAKALTVSAKTPVVTGAASISVPKKALVVTKKTITITAGAAGRVAVLPKALSVSVHAPTVSGAAVVSVSKKSLSVTKKTPVVSGAAVASVSPIALTVTRKTPAVTGAASISVPRRSLYVTRKVPDVWGGAAATVSVPKKSLYVTTKTVIVISAGGATISVPVKHLVVTKHAPVIRAGATIIPFPKRLEVDTHIPVIRARTIGVRGWRLGVGVARGKGLWGFRGYRSGEGDEGDRSGLEGTAGDRIEEGSQW